MKSKFRLVRVRASRRQLIPGILAAALVFALGVKPAQAQTNGTWDGGGVSGIWGGSDNWNPNNQIANGVGATATFANAYGTYADQYNIIVNTARTVGNISFTGTSNNITISRNSANTLTLDVTSGSPTITVSNSARTLTMTTPVLGADGLTKAGAGTLVLSGSNTYTGTTIVSAGNLVAGANALSAAAGALGNSATEVQLGAAGGNNNAGILINGAFTVGRIIRIPTSDGTDAGTRVLTLGGNTAANSIFSGNIFLGTTNQAGRGVTLTAATSGQTTFSGIMQNPTGMDATSYTVTKSGAGAVVLTGANTFTGDITVSAGTLIGAGASSSPGVTVFGARENTRTITVNSTGTLRFDSGNVLGANHLSTTAPTLVINAGGTVTNASPATNNALNNVQINGGTLTATTGSASGYGAWNINGNVTSTGTSTISTSDALNGTVMLKVAGTTNFDVQSGTLSVSAPLIDNMNDTNTGSLSKSGAGTMVLSATNTYSGSTTVTGGTLSLSGTGASNTSSGTTINGADAKLLQGSTVAITPTVTLTQGTLTGNGTVNTVNVGAGTGGIISNNNNVAGAALTIGALTFDGAATVNTFGNTSAPIVTTSLATNVAGIVTINPAATSWAAGTYDLVTYGGGSISGAGFGQFQLGTVTGVSPRQNPTLGNSGTAITLTVGLDDVPYWVGDGDGKWNLASTNNWKLVSDNSYTTFLAGDNTLFNDLATGAGPIAVDIDVANVAPTSTTFNNSTKNYTLGSSTGFGISSGFLTKSGTGTLTITNANTYTGNTVINGGVLDVSTDGAQLYSGANPVTASVTVNNGGVLVVRNFGQVNTVGAGSPSLGNLNNSGGQVVVDGGTLRFNNETGARGRVINIGANGATLDVVNNSTYTWSTSPGTSVPFTGSGQTLTLTGDATSTGTINLVIGGTNVSLLKTGAATWTLGGTNTYTGNTTINAGTLSMSANRITTSPTIFIGNGATWNSTGGLTLAANQSVTGTGTTGSVTTTTTTGLITTSGSTISTSGALSITRLSILGTGNQITGGNIQSGGAGASQRGLLVGNGGTGVLTITGGTLTTNGSVAANIDVLGNTASTGDGTLVINGGSYVSSGVGQLNLGNTSASGTLTVTSGSATVPTLIFNAGTTGTKTSAIVNLDGGILTLNNIVVTSGTTKEFNFNGGQLIAGANFSAFSGLTMNVKDGGANINTNGFSLAISDPLLNNGTGGLVKSGLGTLTLSGVNTYTGGTSVTGGILRFSTAAASATNVTVAGGAEAGALVALDNGQWVNTADLSLQNNGAALVDYGSTVPSITIAPVSVTNFVNGTTPGVRLAGAAVPALTVGQTLPLITWSGTGPADGSTFGLRNHRLFGTFSVASNTLSLTITKNAIGPIDWNTGNGTWDTVATNWVDEDLTATAYIDPLDAVTFGDAAGVSGNPVVTLATTVSPTSMTMDTASRNYTVSGAGSISGSGGLTLAATNLGTFTLATANNTYSGGTVVNGGTLALGDLTNTLSDTGAVTVDGAAAFLSLGVNSDTVGAVSLKNGASITGSGTLTGSSYAFESGSVSANLAGAAGVVKSTSGTVTLSGANTFSGNTSLTGGTLRLANTGALASSPLVTMTTSSLSLELGTDTPFTTLPLLSGGSGVLTYTIVSDRATPGVGLTHQLGDMNFGSATFSFISGNNVTSDTAGISVTSSSMSSGSAGTSILNPTTAALTITGGVTSTGNNVARTLQLDGIGTSHSIGGVITQTVASALSVSKTNTSNWTLSGLSDIAANNYSGTTTIGQGTLAFTTTNPALTGGLIFGATSGSTSVGTLDLSGVAASATFGSMLVQSNTAASNTVALSSGKTMSINGNVTVGANIANSVASLVTSGSGNLVVGTGGTNTFQVGGATSGTLGGSTAVDLSSLASFTLNYGESGTLRLGDANTGSNAPASSTLRLASSNTITVGNFRIGDGSGGNTTHVLTLGNGANIINANTTNIGSAGSGIRSSGTMVFDAADTTGTLTLRGFAGGSTRTTLNMVNTTGNTAVGMNSTVDLSGHTADVMVGTLTMAKRSANTGGSTSTLTFDQGTLDVTTLNMSDRIGTVGTTTATVNLGDSVAPEVPIATIGNINMAVSAGTGTANANLNISGGNVGISSINMANAATEATATSNVRLTGGITTLTGNITRTGGAGTENTTITLNGGTLDMGGFGIGSSASPISLAAQSGTLRNLGELNGGGALNKSTTGTLVLAGTNTYTGTATVNGGILSIAGTLNPVSSLAVGGGTISFSGAAAQTVTGLVVNAGSSTVTNTNAGATDVLNVGAITRNAGGIVNFANATATNNVIQTSTANTNGILGPWAFVGSDLAMNDGTGNIVAYSSYTDVTRLSSGTKAIANNAASNVRIIEGTGTAGDITLAASGTTVVNTLLQSDSGGTGAANVVIGNGDTLQTNSMVQVINAGTLTVGGPATTAQLQTATAGGDLVIANNSSNALRVNAIISDNTSASSLGITGSGSTVLTGVNTYSGTTTVYGGSTLQLGDGTSGNDGTIANSLSVVNNGALVYNRFGSISYAGVISGTGSVTKEGTGTQTLNGANTYSGGTTINAGTLALGTGGSLLNSGAVVIAPGAVLENAGTTTQTLSGPITGGGTLLLSGSGQFIVNNVGNAYGAVSVTNAGRFIVNTNAAGLPAAATVSISGGGILLTSVGASYANAITLGNNGGLSTRFAGGTTYSNVTLPGTGTVTLNNDDAITTALTISNGQTLTGNLTVQVGGTRMTSTTASLGAVSLTGILTGSGGLTLTSSGNTGNALWGTGSLTLTGANDYTGGTTINQGILTVGAGATLGASTGALSVNNTNTVTTGKSVVLNLASGVDTTVGSLSGAIASPTGGTNTVTINNGGTDTNFTVNQTAAGTYAGVIAGQGNFVLGTSSTSTLTLTGAHTYTGTTTVAAGTLAFVSGSLASPITVSAGASLSFDTSATTTSTSTANISLGTIKITGTPSAASHTLFTAAGGITGTPVLHAPVPGYVLKVVGNSLVLEQAGYGSWAALNGAGANLNEDHDNDGVANGVEYFLGGPNGNTTGFTVLPGVTNTAGALSVTWVMGTGYAGVYGTDFSVETSETLTGIWTTETSGVNVVVSGSDVTYTFPAPLGTKKFARLKVTAP